MKALVVGGAGFIGSNLVDQLIDDGHDVFVFDNLTTGKEENINSKAWFDQPVDIAVFNHNSQFFTKFFSDHKIDTIFHLAARARVQPSIKDPVTFNETNVSGMLSILKLAVDYRIKKFIYSSSSSVYGNPIYTPTCENHKTDPLSPYGAQKLIGEIYCRNFYKTYGLRTTSLRYFNVYGERQLLEGAYCLVVGKFAKQRLNNEPMTIRGDGGQKRDFTYVGDVVKANILAALSENELSSQGTCINIGNGDNRSVNQIANLIGGKVEYIDPVLEPRETLANNALANKLLGWKPTGNIEKWMRGYKEELGI